jgi:hypothetical protein
MDKINNTSFLPEEEEEEEEEDDPTVGQFLFLLCVLASFELAIGLQWILLQRL